MRRNLVAGILLVLLLSLPAMAAVTGSFEQTLKVSGPVQLEVKTGSGDVSIRKGEDGSVRVYGRIRAGEWFSGGDPAEKVRKLQKDPPIEQTGNIIRIGDSKEWALRQNVSISYDIVVPADTKVDASTGSGKLEVDGVRGPAKLHAGSGDVRASAVGSSLDVQTGSGSITVDQVQGDIVAHAGSGDIRMERVSNVDVETGSGQIKLVDMRGRLRAHAGSGDVSVEGAPAGEWRLETGSGDVTLRLPANQGFDFNAHTGSGEIETAQPITVSGSQSRHEMRGKVGSGGPLIDVRTGSGDVRVQ